MRIECERASAKEDIDLIELVQGCWRQKLWFALIAIPIVGIAFAYVLLATPIYQAKMFMRPPTQSEIAQLNYGRGEGTGLAPLSTKDVYAIYIKALQSEAVRDDFFQNYFLPALDQMERGVSRDALYTQLNNVLAVGTIAQDKADLYVITATATDPQVAVDWVSKYAQITAKRAKEELLSGVRSDVSIMADNLEQQIRAMRASANKQRTDQIQKLKEALKVAQSIGLEKPPIIANTLSEEVSAGMGGSLTYMRGAIALKAEIANLEARTSDDPYIPDLRERQEKLNFLRALKIDSSRVEMYKQDGVVETPDQPIKPKKLIIMVVAILFALCVGVLAALARDLWVKRRGGGV